MLDIAAQMLVESYYPAFQSKPTSLPSFYVTSTTLQDGKSVPSIILNGQRFSSITEMHAKFQMEMPAAGFHIDCYDCAVINPKYVPEGSTGDVAPGEKSISTMVTVSGSITCGESSDASSKGFNETFTLVPNPDAGKIKNKGKLTKDFLINTQNIRIVT